MTFAGAGAYPQSVNIPRKQPPCSHALADTTPVRSRGICLCAGDSRTRNELSVPILTEKTTYMECCFVHPQHVVVLSTFIHRLWEKRAGSLTRNSMIQFRGHGVRLQDSSTRVHRLKFHLCDSISACHAIVGRFRRMNLPFLAVKKSLTSRGPTMAAQVGRTGCDGHAGKLPCAAVHVALEQDRQEHERHRRHHMTLGPH